MICACCVVWSVERGASAAVTSVLRTSSTLVIRERRGACAAV
jgi:hypothetical protein